MINYEEIELGLKTYRVGTDGSVFDIERGCPQKTYIGNNGYRRFNHLTVEGKCKTIQVHQLMVMAFLQHIPDGYKIVVDHINGIKTDNHLDNLRLVSNRENLQNHNSHRNGRLVGTCFHKRAQKWMASIRITGTRKYLGYFETELEANQAYKIALQSLPH